MKNIHLLSIDKPSILVKINDELFFANNEREMLSDPSLNIVAQHIYITSDEEIKEGDYVIEDIGGVVYGPIDRESIVENPKKIILTTDQDLIADGVQAIDDEFLEWFVKNPSCEEVEIQCRYNFYVGQDLTDYRIIIPREEPNPFELPKALPDEVFYQSLEAKQETLEEAAENFANSKEWMNGGSSNWVQVSFKKGAKWQAEQKNLRLKHTEALLANCEKALDKTIKESKTMYSEEEAVQLLIKFNQEIQEVEDVREWFKQFKKK